MSPRLKLKRFKATQPAPEILAHYVRFYGNKDLHFTPDSLPPVTAQELFANDHPLTFDLGCGRGDFLIAEATHTPDTNFVGIETHWKSIWDAVHKTHRAGLQNVRYLRADVRRVLIKVPDATVQTIYLLFPPPLKEAFFDESALQQVQRILIPGGAFRFVSDHPDYFQHLCTLIGRTGTFEKIHESQGFEGGITNFQRRWESYGLASLRVEYRKLHSDPPQR